MEIVKLLKRYDRIFQELTNERYQVFTVYDYFITRKAIAKDKINVIIRFDVDYNIYFAYLAAQNLKEKNIEASFYFFASTEQYNIWDNEFVKKISQMGFEVGIHSDHLSRQIQYGIDGISAIKEDVVKFASLIGKPPEGMVFHVGDDNIENWHLYKYLEPESLGLKYHDGFTSNYHNTQFNYFYSRSDYLMSDYYFFSNGWRLRPFMVRSKLRKVEKGASVHIVIHPTFMFKWWKMWKVEYGKKRPPKKWFIALLGKVVRRLGLMGVLNIVLQLLIGLLLLLGKIFYRSTEEERDAYIKKTSYSGEKDFLSQKGMNFWEEKVRSFDLVAGKMVLDLGCGIGQWLIPLAHHNKKVIGIDTCYKSLIYAQEALSNKKIKNSALVKGRGEALPYKNGSFDSIFCYGVLMYTQEFITLQEITRVLKKGGRLLLAIDGPGYFLKNIMDGIKYSHSDSIRLGLIAFANTLIGKYLLKRESPLASFFTYGEIKSLFKHYRIKVSEISPELLEEKKFYTYLGFPIFFKAIGEKL